MENQKNRVYFDRDSNQFYTIRWEDTGNNETSHREYITTPAADGMTENPCKSIKLHRDRTNEINKIIADFDFDKVRKTMVALDWRWASNNLQVPSYTEIKEFAYQFLERSVKDFYSDKFGDLESLTKSCGGFQSIISEKGIELQFVVTNWDTY